MPAGTPLSPWAVPNGFPRFLLFPKCKVHRIAFGLVHRDALTGTCLEIVEVVAGQLAVILIPGDIEIYAVRGFVCVSALHEDADQADDILHGLCRTRLDCRPADAQSVGILI